MTTSLTQFLRSNPAVTAAWAALGTAYGISYLYPVVARFLNANANKDSFPFIKERQIIKIDDLQVFEITPLGYLKSDDESRIIFLSSKGFSTIWPKDLLQKFASTAYKTKMKTYVIDCQIDPQHPEDARVSECYALYLSLLKTFPSEDLFFLNDEGSRRVCDIFYSMCVSNKVPPPQTGGSNLEFFAEHKKLQSRL